MAERECHLEEMTSHPVRRKRLKNLVFFPPLSLSLLLLLTSESLSLSLSFRLFKSETFTSFFPIGTLFVGNLSFDVDEGTLSDFVTSQGHTPSAVRIITRNTGESKG